jgi:hypothetical protein
MRLCRSTASLQRNNHSTPPLTVTYRRWRYGDPEAFPERILACDKTLADALPTPRGGFRRQPSGRG